MPRGRKGEGGEEMSVCQDLQSVRCLPAGWDPGWSCPGMTSVAGLAEGPGQRAERELCSREAHVPSPGEDLRLPTKGNTRESHIYLWNAREFCPSVWFIGYVSSVLEGAWVMVEVG